LNRRQIRFGSKDIDNLPRRSFLEMNVDDSDSSENSEIPTEPYSSEDERIGEVQVNE